MIVGDAAYDRKAETGAVAALAIPAPEALEDQLAFGFGNTGAAIAHAYRTVVADLDIDGGLLRGELDGVFGEVEHRALEHLGIAVDQHGRVGAFERDVLVL